MNSAWCLPLILIIAFQGSCDPNFGIPAIVPGSLSVRINANLLKVSLNEVAKPIRRLPKDLHSERLQKAADNISKLAIGIVEKGRKLATLFYRAAIERADLETNPFTSLYLSFGELGQLLSDDGPVYVWNLYELLGSVTANELHEALGDMDSSLVDTLQSANNLELAIQKSLTSEKSVWIILGVHNVWCRELADALVDLKHQVRIFGKAVDAAVKSIEVSNKMLGVVKTNLRMLEIVFQHTLSTFHSTIDSEVTSSLKKYTSAQKNFQSHLTTASKGLKSISSEKSLKALSELHIQEFTNNYHDLSGRNKSDMAFIQNMFHWIRSKATNDLDGATELFFAVVDDSASSLVSVVLARERFAEQCSGKYFPKLMSPFPGFQTKITTCLSRERSRVSKISNAIGHTLSPVQLNSVDFINEVGNCSRFGSSSIKEVNDQQSIECLKANLREVYSYNRLMNAELDSLKAILPSAVEASRSRTRQCIMQTVIETSVVLSDVKNGLLTCAVNGP